MSAINNDSFNSVDQLNQDPTILHCGFVRRIIKIWRGQALDGLLPHSVRMASVLQNAVQEPCSTLAAERVAATTLNVTQGLVADVVSQPIPDPYQNFVRTILSRVNIPIEIRDFLEPWIKNYAESLFHQGIGSEMATLLITMVLHSFIRGINRYALLQEQPSIAALVQECTKWRTSYVHTNSLQDEWRYRAAHEALRIAVEQTAPSNAWIARMKTGIFLLTRLQEEPWLFHEPDLIQEGVASALSFLEKSTGTEISNPYKPLIEALIELARDVLLTIDDDSTSSSLQDAGAQLAAMKKLYDFCEHYLNRLPKVIRDVVQFSLLPERDRLIFNQIPVHQAIHDCVSACILPWWATYITSVEELERTVETFAEVHLEPLLEAIVQEAGNVFEDITEEEMRAFYIHLIQLSQNFSTPILGEWLARTISQAIIYQMQHSAIY